MSTLKLKLWIIALVGMIVVSSFAVVTASGGLKKKQMVTVRARDIPETVQILGSCGQPLGSLLTIRGKWVGPGLRMDPGPFFEVSLVNGKEPEDKVEFAWGQMEVVWSNGHPGRGPKPGELWDWRFDWDGRKPSLTPSAGETWEMLGAETIHPDRYYLKEVLDAIRRPGGVFDPDVDAQRAFFVGGFNTRFDYIAIRKLK